MKKIILLSILIVAFLSKKSIIHSQTSGNGPTVTETISMGTITSISIGVSADVYLSQGNTQSIKIKGQKNIIDLLNKKADGKSWEIKTRDNKRIRNYEKLEIHITIAEIENLSIGGSGSFIGEEKFSNLDNLGLSIGGSGSISLDVAADDIRCSIGGSGSINLEGTADELSAEIAGAGNVNAISLVVDDCMVNTAGSGSVEVHVNDELNVNIAGSGNVKYKGAPEVNKNIIGSGKVKKY